MSRRSTRPRPQPRDQGLDLFDQYRTDNVRGSVASGTGTPSLKRAVQILGRPHHTPRAVWWLVVAVFGLMLAGFLISLIFMVAQG